MAGTATKEAPRQKFTESKTIDFVRLEPIIKIVRACIWTGRLAREKPVSAVLIAEQESAKTEALKFFKGTTTLKYFSDLTSKGIEGYQREIESGYLRHVIINDLVRIVAHNPHVTERTIQTLSTMIEEGPETNADAGGRTDWKSTPTIGCLMGVTPSYFQSRAGKWRKSGFLSRFLPVRFTYSKDTIHRIHAAIADGHKLPQAQPIKLPEFPTEVSMPADAAAHIMRRAESLGEKSQLFGFRYHRALRSLAKAFALMNQRHEVSKDDVAEILALSDFFEREVHL